MILKKKMNSVDAAFRWEDEKSHNTPAYLKKSITSATIGSTALSDIEKLAQDQKEGGIKHLISCITKDNISSLMPIKCRCPFRHRCVLDTLLKHAPEKSLAIVQKAITASNIADMRAEGLQVLINSDSGKADDIKTHLKKVIKKSDDSVSHEIYSLLEDRPTTKTRSIFGSQEEKKTRSIFGGNKQISPEASILFCIYDNAAYKMRTAINNKFNRNYSRERTKKNVSWLRSLFSFF